jgi:hypothetical protein
VLILHEKICERRKNLRKCYQEVPEKGEKEGENGAKIG